MTRSDARAFPAAAGEVRLPPACWTAMGLTAGQRVLVEAVEGRLLVTPFFDLQGIHTDLDDIASDLEAVRTRLREATTRLPQPAADAELADLPETLAGLGADLLGTLECVLGDDIEPALAKLREAVAATRTQAWTEPAEGRDSMLPGKV